MWQLLGGACIGTEPCLDGCKCLGLCAFLLQQPGKYFNVWQTFVHVCSPLHLKRSSWVAFPCYGNEQYLIILEDEAKKRENLKNKTKPTITNLSGESPSWALEPVGFVHILLLPL